VKDTPFATLAAATALIAWILSVGEGVALTDIGFTVGLTNDSQRNEQMIDNLEVKNADSKTWLSALL
jgi:hypothetical protein